MISEVKICPKCKKSMIPSGSPAFLPAQLDNGLVNYPTAFSLKAGIPVQPYICGSCRFVELYYGP
jgi:hypothetical protein